MNRKENVRPIGYINVYDPRGYAFIPRIVRKELNIEGKDKIPFFLDANVVLLVRKNVSKEEILRGLDLLKEDLKLRWKENGEGGEGD